jgi:peptide/nickel transport system substrate-binding protein
MIRTRRVAAALLALAMVGAACGGDDDDGGSTGEGTAGEGAASEAPGGGECTEDRVGGSVTMGMFSEVAGLDPVVASGAGVAGAIENGALYDTLMRYDPEAGEYRPHLAESLEPNDDLSEWTLQLRDGITFANGDPLDGEAVKASIERHSTEENVTTSRVDVGNIAEITVVDPLTVRFTLTEPWGDFPFVLAERPGMITNPTAVEAAGEDFSTDPPPEAGVGPFELERFVPGEEIVMRARSDYWDGPVCIEELRFVTLAGAQATYEAFQNDELQVAFLRQAPTIAEAKEDGVAGFSNFMNMGAMLLVNNGAEGTDPPTADVRVRQAMAAAIDPEALDDRTNEGTGFPSSAIVGGESRLDPGVEGPELDPERAAELVEEVKSDTGWDGSLHLVCQDDPINTEQCIAIQAMLDAAGFDVELDNMSVADAIRQVLVDRDFDAASWGVPASDATFWRALSQFHSEAPNNRTGYANPDMDAALEELKSATTDEEQEAALADIQEIWNESVPSVGFAAREEFVAVADGLNGIDHSVMTMVLFDNAYFDS